MAALQDRIDIGRALEELYLVKPEQLDSLDFRIARTEIDSTLEQKDYR